MNVELVLEFLIESWQVLVQMAPYLLFGFLVAGILSVYISTEWVEKHLGGKGMLPAFKAAVFGVPLPLCSCGVIPVAAGIYRHGASRSATTSFLLSTPQTGVDSIFVTYGLLGPVFAIFRPIVALLTGIIGGAAVMIADNERPAKVEAKTVTQTESGDSCDCDSCEESDSKITRVLKYGFINLPKDIGGALLIGIVIAGVMGALVPPDYLGGLIGGGIISILILMLAGVPVYVCATASVPIAAGFIHMGASPGAALAFLVAGPATNAATFTTIMKVMGKKTAIIYLSTVAVSAVLSGLLLNWIVPAVENIMPQLSGHVHDEMGTGLLSNIWAVILVAVMFVAYFYKPGKELSEKEEVKMNAEKIEIAVSGMTCSHCAMSVKKATSEIAGVEVSDVNLDDGKVTLQGKGINADEVVNTINSLGYSATK